MARPCTNDDSWINRKIQAMINGIVQRSEVVDAPRFFAMMSLETREWKRGNKLESCDERWEMEEASCSTVVCHGDVMGSGQRRMNRVMRERKEEDTRRKGNNNSRIRKK